MTVAEFRAKLMDQLDAHGDEINAQAQANIEQYRKRAHKIRILDKNGKPVAGAKVHVNQQTHDFKFGANMFMLDEFEDPEVNQRYRETFPKYFNFGTVPFYWAGLEPEEGKPRYEIGSPKVHRRPAPDLCMQFCEENNILPKVHCLCYDKVIPDWLPKNDKEAMWKLYEKRFQEISQRYAGRMYEIEVTNELVASYGWTTCSILANEPDTDLRMFEMARKYFPQDKLLVHDCELADVGWAGCRSPYYLQIHDLLRRGAQIDKIGVQNHIFIGVSGDQEADIPTYYRHFMVDRIFNGLKTLSSFGKPIGITEVTIPTVGEDGLEAEQLQADMLRVLYTIWFSTPLMDSITYWNLADYSAVTFPKWDENNCRGGIFHKDMTPKLAALELYRLVHEEWHTELELTTDAEGYVNFRGFYGDYTADVNGETIHFGVHKGGLQQTNYRSQK